MNFLKARGRDISRGLLSFVHLLSIDFKLST